MGLRHPVADVPDIFNLPIDRNVYDISKSENIFSRICSIFTILSI